MNSLKVLGTESMGMNKIFSCLNFSEKMNEDQGLHIVNRFRNGLSCEPHETV